MTTHNTNDCLCNESILNGNEVDNNCPVHNLEDDLLINNQQTSSNCVQGGEVGDTVKKNETHKSSFSSPADFKMTEKTIKQLEKEIEELFKKGFGEDNPFKLKEEYPKQYVLEFGKYCFQKAKELEQEKVRRLKEEIKVKSKGWGTGYMVIWEIIDSIFGSELAGVEE